MTTRKNRPSKKSSKRTARRNLTPKQEKFISAYADPASPDFGNATRAAGSAGYSGSPGALAVQGHANLKNPQISAAIQDLLHAAGATPELAAQRLAESMNASTVRVFLTKNQKLKYSRPLPNFGERRAASVVVLRLHGLTDPPQKVSAPNSEFPEFAPSGVLSPAALPADPEALEALRQVEQFSVQDRMLLREGFTAVGQLSQLIASDPELSQRYAGKSMWDILNEPEDADNDSRSGPSAE